MNTQTRPRSQKQTIYAAYRAKVDAANEGCEPHVFRPNRDDHALLSGLEPFTHESRMTWYGGYHGAYELPDGRIVERANTTSGTMECWAIWESKAAWLKYRQPMSSRAYFEEW